MKSLAGIGGFSQFTGLFKLMYNEFTTKASSEKTYRVIVPVVKERVYQGYTFKDKELQEMVELLRSLAPYGAKESNFSRRYLVDERTLLDLPDDPDRLSPGYWW
ncbi:hypothetical protein Q4491_04435 [Photobacterium sp. 2_MG-2023]|uniref:hypothetical protein n=1 Tax=Photobacterium TaxID=657 RepID=UPI0026E2423E|nr:MULTISPECIES: hypothetical protein [Photobacterium]MDO6580585.1 hypothetical protein [Photobacterium sp. 2_MG-2023]